MFDSLSPKSVWPRRWLQLAVLSLAISGIFSIILVISRTPQLIAHFPWMKALFSVSLVIHVDLSVLVWFLAMTGLLWSALLVQQKTKIFPFAQGASWGCVLAAVLCMAASPLTGEWEVVKSNYVPVITNGLFFIGLGLLFVGMLIGMLQAFAARPSKQDTISMAVYMTLPITLIAALCFAASASGIPAAISGLAFYENLFWAGGHVLQFIYVQIMLIAWVVLAQVAGYATPPRKLLWLALLVQPVAAMFAFVPYALHDVMSHEHMRLFTLLMDATMGIGGGLLGLYYAFAILSSSRTKPQAEEGSALDSSNASALFGMTACKSALLTSFLLFILGGVFGAAINGPNVRIPAHYHGSIVAVTLALMGLAYYLLPKLGGREVSHWRSARIQPWLYAVGQILHITGLAVSGGYGVLRKSVGDVGAGGWEVKAALGMMGGGGLLAIIGGLMFVVIMVKGFRAVK